MSSKNESKIDFGITPEYFSKLNITPIYIKLCYLSLLNYEYYNEYIPNKLETNYKNLESKYLSKLPFDYKEKVKKVKEGIKINQNFYNKIANMYKGKFDYIKLTEAQIRDFDYQQQGFLSKFFLQILVRDWAEEGKEERSKTILPVIQELKNYYNYENKTLLEKGINILVIGSRFGRIVYELAKLGYNVEANETNFFYLFVANYLFNYSKKNENCICPRISSFCSSFTEESVIKKHFFPDEDILSDLKNIKKDSIKVTKKVFEEEYLNKKDLFDCVITLFSTDETSNIINFTEMVNSVLKKGGIWINLGGLSSIYTDFGGLDLTWEEWKHIILKSGFEIKKDERPVVPFCKIEGHSLPFAVGSVFFTARKI